MAGAKSEDETKDPLDEILKAFNEAFKTDVLDKSIHTDGYLEIDNV